MQFVDTIAHHITSSPGFGSWPFHVDFVVKNKVALGQVYLLVLRIAPVKIITTLLHTHILSIYFGWYTLLAADSIVKRSVNTAVFLSDDTEAEGFVVFLSSSRHTTKQYLKIRSWPLRSSHFLINY
jgi:hypothetical protein